ncbi:hypothetical protein [Agrobacterium bohemicum]|uniref:Uncharacterized protein n=1 Tax=Agrobacterium bohemicum TaxID=2052828 RepID=A0A135P045_9HYPH|nr:hypothetical protein [Agrobacterium bohemicum]KXG84778.1 hypothetical protein ATO67_12130 [Agrobacterium bohemicum]
MLKATFRIGFWANLVSIAFIFFEQGAAFSQLVGPSTEALATANNHSTGVLVQGIEVGDFSKLNVWTNLKPVEFSTSHHAVIGKYVADKLGIKVGDKFLLVHPTGISTPLGHAPQMLSFDVAAIIQLAPFAEATITVYIAPKRFEELSGTPAANSGR